MTKYKRRTPILTIKINKFLAWILNNKVKYFRSQLQEKENNFKPSNKVKKYNLENPYLLKTSQNKKGKTLWR